MNKKYICLRDIALVEDENGYIDTREYDNNLDEVLKKENRIETIERIIKEDQNEKEKYKFKANIFKILSDKSSWIIYGTVALYYLFQSGFNINGIIKMLIVLGTGKIILTTERFLFNYFTKITNGLAYKINNSKELLKSEIKELQEIKNKKSTSIISHNEYIRIDDLEDLDRLERNLYLAYLYKLKEDIILKKINDNTIEFYLKTLKIDNETLEKEDIETILSYSKKKCRRIG